MFAIDSDGKKRCLRQRIPSYLTTVCGGMHVYITLFLGYRNGPNVGIDAAFGGTIIVCDLTILGYEVFDRCNNSRFSNCIHILLLSRS